MNSFYSFIFLLFLLNFDKVLTVDPTCAQAQNAVRGHWDLLSCGRFGNRLFWILRKTRFDLTEATDACKKVPNGNLASIRNDEENKFLYSLGSYMQIYTNNADDMLTGLHRRSMNCTQPFVWTDGTEFAYEDWKEGEPDCKYGDQHAPTTPATTWGTQKCVVLHRWTSTGPDSYSMPRYGWKVVSCELAHPSKILCAVTLTAKGSSTNT